LPTSFKDQQEQLTSAQHHKAVWEALYKFLDENFIAHDGGNPKKAIAAHDCLVQVVPEDVIEDVLRAIAQEKIQPIEKTMEKIMSQEVVILEKDGN
jgi:hypothetical protein